MRKRNKLNNSIVSNMFDTDSDSEKNSSYFKVYGDLEPKFIEIPTSIMHRLYRLGQAYGIRQLRSFESETKVIVGSSEMKQFSTDLETLRNLINDEALHAYIEQFINVINKPSIKIRYIAVSAGNYFERTSRN